MCVGDVAGAHAVMQSHAERAPEHLGELRLARITVQRSDELAHQGASHPGGALGLDRQQLEESCEALAGHAPPLLSSSSVPVPGECPVETARGASTGPHGIPNRYHGSS